MALICLVAELPEWSVLAKKIWNLAFFLRKRLVLASKFGQSDFVTSYDAVIENSLELLLLLFLRFLPFTQIDGF